MAQIISTYSSREAEVAMAVSSLPIWPTTELIAMMRPERCRIMGLSAAWHRVKDAVRFVLITSSQSARQGTPSDEAGVPSARVLKVPHRAALRPGDLLTVTASASSSGLVGDRFVVSGEEERSFAGYRRYLLRGNSWRPSSEPVN